MKRITVSISAIIIFAAGFMLGCNNSSKSAAINNVEAQSALPAAINHPNTVNAARKLHSVPAAERRIPS
ncbi:hypothetical protein [Pectinatus haikarae]|uniref:ABC-type anion transport system duplicated permease subunit n=1 Tax=Pectinatus haikarae TaxID=349096 RepID=A0ABT9Y923_9FIRM|nr:hypothetical protein [Pectinatus haikarae]MDQ0204352.1 ABC-type anion transport system duplicated permease subunit [Pectinatus haikarae]